MEVSAKVEITVKHTWRKDALYTILFYKNFVFYMSWKFLYLTDIP